MSLAIHTLAHKLFVCNELRTPHISSKKDKSLQGTLYKALNIANNYYTVGFDLTSNWQAINPQLLVSDNKWEGIDWL